MNFNSFFDIRGLILAGFRKTGVYPDAISCNDVTVSENQDEEGSTTQVLNTVFFFIGYFRYG